MQEEKSPATQLKEKTSRTLLEGFHKIAQTVIQARINLPPQSIVGSESAWFNLTCPDVQDIRRQVEKQVKWDPTNTPATLHIDICLSAHSLPKHVLLERWRVGFSKESGGAHDFGLMYKKLLVLMRSLMSLILLLPTNALVKAAKANMGDAPFALYYQLYSYSQHQKSFDSTSRDFCFRAIDTSLGKLNVMVLYRIDTDFEFARTKPINTNFFVIPEYFPVRPLNQSMPPSKPAPLSSSRILKTGRHLDPLDHHRRSQSGRSSVPGSPAHPPPPGPAPIASNRSITNLNGGDYQMLGTPPRHPHNENLRESSSPENSAGKRRASSSAPGPTGRSGPSSLSNDGRSWSEKKNRSGSGLPQLSIHHSSSLDLPVSSPSGSPPHHPSEQNSAPTEPSTAYLPAPQGGVGYPAHQQPPSQQGGARFAKISERPGTMRRDSLPGMPMHVAGHPTQAGPIQGVLSAPKHPLQRFHNSGRTSPYLGPNGSPYHAGQRYPPGRITGGFHTPTMAPNSGGSGNGLQPLRQVMGATPPSGDGPRTHSVSPQVIGQLPPLPPLSLSPATSAQRQSRDTSPPIKGLATGAKPGSAHTTPQLGVFGLVGHPSPDLLKHSRNRFGVGLGQSLSESVERIRAKGGAIGEPNGGPPILSLVSGMPDTSRRRPSTNRSPIVPALDILGDALDITDDVSHTGRTEEDKEDKSSPVTTESAAAFLGPHGASDMSFASPVSGDGDEESMMGSFVRTCLRFGQLDMLKQHAGQEWTLGQLDRAVAQLELTLSAPTNFHHQTQVPQLLTGPDVVNARLP